VSDTLGDVLAAAGFDALPDLGPSISSSETVPHARPDPGRERRKGVPEVVYTAGKSVAASLDAARALLEQSGRAILSRVDDDLELELRKAFAPDLLRLYRASRMAVVKDAGFVPPNGGGRIAVLTAGTSDVPIAEEAAVVAGEMGCAVLAAYDVGVAGLHRLTEPLRQIREHGADAVVVAAGMDGALPSVVCGLVDVPVVGLPTSVGYGMGGKGVAALLSMLQTCSPGLAVVNIDNGVGAGATAALIANRVAAARRAAVARATAG
jgi:NCAIR mutase (PurE)-related protein